MKKAMFQNALFGLTSFMMLRQQKIFSWRKKESSIQKVANDSLIKAAKRKMKLQEQNTPTRTIITYIVQYNLSRYSRDAFEALVDRRAHGGIAGGDGRLITQTDRVVDVTGIHNHQMERKSSYYLRWRSNQVSERQHFGDTTSICICSLWQDYPFKIATWSFQEHSGR